MRLSGRMLASVLVFTPGLWAQVNLTLADAISQALASNPQIATTEAHVGMAEGLRHQAGLAPNPASRCSPRMVVFGGVHLFLTRPMQIALHCSPKRSKPVESDSVEWMLQPRTCNAADSSRRCFGGESLAKSAALIGQPLALWPQGTCFGENWRTSNGLSNTTVAE